MAEFEKLRVGILQKLDRSFRPSRIVVDKGSVPSNHGEIVWVIRNSGLEDFLAFTIGEHRHLAAYDLRNVVSLRCQQIVGRGGAIDFAYMKDEVVFLQPFTFVRLHQRRRRPLQFLPDDSRRESFKIAVRGPSAGKLHQRFPTARERQFEYQADDAVIVVLDFALKQLAALED